MRKKEGPEGGTPTKGNTTLLGYVPLSAPNQVKLCIIDVHSFAPPCKWGNP